MNAQDYIALPLALAAALYALGWMWRSIRDGGGCGPRCGQKSCKRLTGVTRDADADAGFPLIQREEQVG
jgi:hypothetical protein